MFLPTIQNIQRTCKFDLAPVWARRSSSRCRRRNWTPGASKALRLLLDTHALLWWLDGDQRLPARLRRLIGDDANVVYESAASA